MFFVNKNGLQYVREKNVAYGKKATKAERRAKGARKSKSNKPDGHPPEGRYIDFRSDFGFKYLLGQPGCEQRLRKFLNDLLQHRHKVGELQYLNTEKPGANVRHRKSLFDILCKDTSMANILLEMQVSHQRFFVKRSIYYQSTLIAALGEKGGWEFDLEPVILICITNFSVKDGPEYIHFARERYDEDYTPTNDGIYRVNIELNKFHKNLDELETDLDKWLYLLKHLHTLKEMPKEFDTDVFRGIFEAAETANFKSKNSKMKVIYKTKQQEEWDTYSQLETAREDGKIEGKIEGRVEGMVEGERKGKLEEKKAFIKTLLQSTDFSMARIAAMVKAPLTLVRKVKQTEMTNA